MAWYGTWHGGASCTSPADAPRELFTSLAAAADALRERYASNGRTRCTFRTVDPSGRVVEVAHVYTPCVDETSELHLYASPDPMACDYPARRVYFGPRGGIRVEGC